MATVCALILFDALRSDVESSDRRQITSLSRPQLRDAMAAHPAWEGKAFEDTSFNTVPEDLGEQLQQFVHEDFAAGQTWRFRFAGPTKKFRKDQTTRELFLEIEYEASPQSSVVAPPLPQSGESRRKTWLRVAPVIVAAAAALFVLTPHRTRTAPLQPAREVTIAVVPFRLVTPDPQLQFLGVGIADAIITRVSNLEPVRVRPTATVLRYANSDHDAQSIGRDLGADYVLAGTLQETKDLIRSSVQLVRSADGASVWGQQFDVPRSDLLALEDAIASRVAASLHLRLSDEHRDRLARHGTHDPAAYEHYLRGRGTLLQLTKEDTERAIREFEAAVALDPRYAAARAGLANAAAQMRKGFASGEESKHWGARAKEEAARALELAPDLAEAHEALAAVYRYDEFDFERVMDESGRAIALNPDLGLPHLYRSAGAFHLGLIDTAEREARAGIDLDRERPIEAVRLLGASALARGKWSDAENYLSEVTRRSDIGEYYEALALFHLGRVRDAEVLLRREGGGETRQARAHAALASILGATHRVAETQALADRTASGYIDHHVAYSLGVAYGQLGDHAKAVQWLTRAVETGFPCYPFFQTDPLLEPVRGDAAFRALVDDLRRRHERWGRKYR